MRLSIRHEVVGRIGAVGLLPMVLPGVFWADANHYWEALHHLSATVLPYRDRFWEFPPFTLVAAVPAVVLPRQLFVLAFGMIMAAAEFASLAFLRRRNPDQTRSINRAWYSAVAPLAPLIWFRFEALVLLSVTVLVADRGHRWAARAAIAGFGVKLWPPLLLVAGAVRGEAKVLGRAVAGCAIVLIAWWAWSPSGFAEFLTFRRGSGFQIESIIGSVLLASGQSPREASLSWVVGHGAAVIDPILTSLWLIAVLAGAWWGRRRIECHRLAWAGAVVGGLLVMQRLLSPQYLVWMIPVVVLLAVEGRQWFLRCFVAISLSTDVYLARYTELIRGEIMGRVVLLARNAALVTLLGLFLWETFRAEGLENVDRPPEARASNERSIR